MQYRYRPPIAESSPFQTVDSNLDPTVRLTIRDAIIIIISFVFYNLKVRYLKENGYGGVMIWTFDLDDFNGSCGGGKYPLLSAIAGQCLEK